MAGEAFAPLETTHSARGPTRGALRASRTREPHAPHRVRDGRNGRAPGLYPTGHAHAGRQAAPVEIEAHVGCPELWRCACGVPVTVIRCRDASSNGSDEMEEEMLNQDNSHRYTRTGRRRARHSHRPGSTGAPKAVVSPCRSLASHAARAAQHPYADDDVTGVCVLACGTRSAPSPGPRLRCYHQKVLADGAGVGTGIDDKVTRAMLTPSLAELLVAAAAHAESVHAREALDAMRVLVLCGETPRSGLVERARSPQQPMKPMKYSKNRVVANLYS